MLIILSTRERYGQPHILNSFDPDTFEAMARSPLSHQPCRFVEVEDGVHVLDGLAGGAFDHVVDGAEDDDGGSAALFGESYG